MGHRTEWQLVRLEWQMEWRCEAGTGPLCHGISSHRGPDAAGGRGQFAVGLARELVRRARGEMGYLRELLSRGRVLRLGWAQCVWPFDADNTRRNGEFQLQDGYRLSAADQSGSGEAGGHRGVRM